MFHSLTRLRGAAKNGQMMKIVELLKSGKDPNQTDAAGYVALHYAAREGYLEICQLLLAAKANPNAATSSGKVRSLLFQSTQKTQFKRKHLCIDALSLGREM